MWSGVHVSGTRLSAAHHLIISTQETSVTFSNRILDIWNNSFHSVTLVFISFQQTFPFFASDEDVSLRARIWYSNALLLCIMGIWCLCARLCVFSCQSTEVVQHFRGTPHADNPSWPMSKSWMKLALTPAYINQRYRQRQIAWPDFDPLIRCWCVKRSPIRLWTQGPALQITFNIPDTDIPDAGVENIVCCQTLLSYG